MKHISILVPKGEVALGCIEGPFILFNKVNDFLIQMKQPPMFKVQLVGIDLSEQRYHQLFTVKPDTSISKLAHTDLIIIPAVNGEMEQVIATNHAFLPWITKQFHGGAELASLCVGAFILASTGLVDGKRCSTHWGAAQDFKRMFPKVNLVSEKIITDEQGIYSSGGANSFWNLLLYLVEKFVGREMAIFMSKYYEIEIDRESQSPFIIFNTQKDHGDETIIKAQAFIENNFNSKITVDALAAMHALGRRNMERRFKKATSNTVAEYIQRVKVEAAKKNLETTRKNINEVMYDVGYSDIKTFRSIFKKTTGLSPIDYRNKYNREAVIN